MHLSLLAGSRARCLDDAARAASVVFENDPRDEEPGDGPEGADRQHGERADPSHEPLALLATPPHPGVLALGELGLLRGEVPAEIFDLVLPGVGAALLAPLDPLLDLADVAAVAIETRSTRSL